MGAENASAAMQRASQKIREAAADQEQRRSDAMKFAQNASEKTIKARNPSVPTLFLLSMSQGARKENIARDWRQQTGKYSNISLNIFALVLLAVACCQRSAAEQPLQEPLLDSLNEVRDA